MRLKDIYQVNNVRMSNKNWINEEVKKWNLDDEEREILEARARGKIKSVPNLAKEKKRYQSYAHHTLKKIRKSESVSIRLNPDDLNVFKTRAAEEGLPYQTLISSLVHKYGHRKKIA